MHDTSRLGYAQARIQARHAARPGAAFWRQLESGQDYEHVLETLRTSVIANAVSGLSAASDVHEIEARLRHHWASECATVAGWYPPPWRPAFEWLACFAWLPALAWLQHGRPPLAWMHADARLAPIASTSGEERIAALADGPFAPFAAAWPAGESLTVAWEAHWRSLWRPLEARHAAGLESLARINRRLWPAFEAGPGPAADALFESCATAATRLFRRHGSTAVAGLAFLTLGWLETARLVAALAVPRLFGVARAA